MNSLEYELWKLFRFCEALIEIYEYFSNLIKVFEILLDFAISKRLANYRT